MTETPSTPLPSWLHDLGIVELVLSPSPIIPGGDLAFSVAVTPPLVKSMQAMLLLTHDAVTVAEWVIAVPTTEVTVTIPNDIQPGDCELVLRRDNWEFDVVPIVIESASTLERSQTYERALVSSSRFAEALRKESLEEAYVHAASAAAAYISLNSPATAADLYRECASALLAGGKPAMASLAAFKAFEAYQTSKDDLSAKATSHLLTRALAQQALQERNPQIALGKAAAPKGKAKKIRILIANASEIKREGIKKRLQLEKDFEVVGEAGDGREVLKRVRELDPNILLLDMRLPNLDKFSVLQAQLQADKRKPIILFFLVFRDNLFLAFWDNKEFVQAKSMVFGDIAKSRTTPSDWIVNSIRNLHSNEVWPDSHTKVQSWILDLSAREREIRDLVSIGYKNKEIAKEMSISEQTLQKYLQNIMKKFRDPLVPQRYVSSSPAKRKSTA